MDSGWRRVDLPGNAGMRQCECVVDKARRRALALIPERFATAPFNPSNPEIRSRRGHYL